MSMYTLAKELFPPTGIERVVRCNFVRPDVLNVIVAKSSVLEIYSFVEPLQADLLPRLDLVASYRLNGIITSLGVIRTSSSGQHGLDSVLVSFKDAKVGSYIRKTAQQGSHARGTNVPKTHNKHGVNYHKYQPPFLFVPTLDALFFFILPRCPCWSGHFQIIVLSQCRSTITNEMTTRYSLDHNKDQSHVYPLSRRKITGS